MTLMVATALAGAAGHETAASIKDASFVSDQADAIPGARARALEAKLLEFRRKSGVTIVFIFAQTSPTEEEDKVPGAVMRALSARQGLIEDGVLVAHFPVDDDWRVWIGNKLASRFAGKPGTAQELTESGAMHDAKEAWFEKVNARADAILKARTAGESDPKEKLAVTADAIADGLIERLSPQSVAN